MKKRIMLVIALLGTWGWASIAPAAAIEFISHSKTLDVDSYNTHYIPGFGIDTAGALPGADDTHQSTNLNGVIISAEQMGYGPDIFGRRNAGGYTAMVASGADEGAYVFSSQLSPTIDGEAAPQITLASDSSTVFRVDADTYASLSVSFSGSIPTTKDHVGGSIIEYDPATGNRTAIPFVMAAEFSGLHTSGSTTVEVFLRADREYVLQTDADARANASTDLGPNNYSSGLTLSLMVAQSTALNSEANPLKPANRVAIENAAFGQTTAMFSIDAAVAEAGGMTWIDPEIAVGFDYEIFGASVAAITLPSLASVHDLTGYEIYDAFGTLLGTASAGDVFDFTSPLIAFSIRGIDTGLMLDPGAVGIFTLGLDFTDPTGNVITVHQTPLTANVAVVPVAGTLLLLVSGFCSSGFRQRQNRGRIVA